MMEKLESVVEGIQNDNRKLKDIISELPSRKWKTRFDFGNNWRSEFEDARFV